MNKAPKDTNAKQAAVETLRAEEAALAGRRHALEVELDADARLAETESKIAANTAMLATQAEEIKAGEAKVAGQAAEIKTGRAVLQQLSYEKEAIEREIRHFELVAVQQDKDFAQRLRTLVPSEPDLTEEEKANA